MIEITSVLPIGCHFLEIEFSDGATGVHDFVLLTTAYQDIVRPLHDQTYFAKVFVRNGNLTWPNGFTYKSDDLYRQMQIDGTLKQLADAF